jgi:cyanophycin synthetase
VTPGAALAPDPMVELRPTALRLIRGPNYWAMRPLARLDMEVGAYDELSSAEVRGVPEQLVEALPPLALHACSVGVPGGFVQRLVRGTYAPHILEHVALALQEMAGHDVGFGRARGGTRAGAYVVVVAYRHPAVGRRALAHALALVQRAFAGLLTPEDAAAAAEVLRERAARPPAGEDRPPESPPLIAAGVVAGDAGLRAEAVRALRDAGAADLAPGGTVCGVAPAALLADGLPYRRARIAVVADAAPGAGVPEGYRERDRAVRLMTVPLDALAPDGIAVVPAGDREVAEHARSRAATVLTFDHPGEIPGRAREAVRALRAAGGVRDAAPR